MIKVFYGKKGTGKTKNLLENANNIVAESKGSVVFIDYTDELIMKLARDIRFINIKDYPVESVDAFLGFISGVASQNYDIETVFVDGLKHIVGEDADLEAFFKGLEKIASDEALSLFISITGDEDNTPEYIKKYL